MKKLFFVALTAAIIPFAASAQTQRDSVPQALERVDSGATLRVRTERVTTRGTFAGLGNDAFVLLSTTGAPTPIRFDAVEEIWRQGHYAKHGAIIGGSIGAAVLTGFGFLLISGLCETDDGCRSDYPKVALYGIGVGGGAGALLGAGVGYLTKRWIKLY